MALDTDTDNSGPDRPDGVHFDPRQIFGDGVHYVNANEIQGLWTYVKSLDWEETWLYYLLAGHILLMTIIVLTRRISSFQSILFVVLLIIVYEAEDLNEYLAKNHKLFTKHQYFDSPGLFISVILSAPLLLDCCFIVGNWFMVSTRLMKELHLQKSKFGEKSSDNAATALEKKKTD